MNDFDNFDDEDGLVVHPLANDQPYTLRFLDFVGIALHGASYVIQGIGQGLHLITSLAAQECYAAANGRRLAAAKKAERQAFEEYVRSHPAPDTPEGLE